MEPPDCQRSSKKQLVLSRDVDAKDEGAITCVVSFDPNASGLAKVEKALVDAKIEHANMVDGVQGYRAMFDLKLGDSSLAPVDLRLYLRADGQPLTETWLYQWTPPERRP